MESDVEERTYWDEYQSVYQGMIQNTSTENSPWYVIPSDIKHTSRLIVSNTILETMEKLDLKYPEVSPSKIENFQKCKEILLG